MKNLSAKYLVSSLFVGLCMFVGCSSESNPALPVANQGAVSSSSVAPVPVSNSDATLLSSAAVVSSSSVAEAPVSSGNPEVVPTSSADVLPLSSANLRSRLRPGL